MAVTIGATLPVTLPLRHLGIGPFISSGGNVYFVGRTTASNADAAVVKATDPIGGSFAVQDNANRLLQAGEIQYMSVYQVGDVLHIAGGLSSGLIRYATFSMATDLWVIGGVGETVVAAAAFTGTLNYPSVSLVVRSGGEVVVIYGAGLTVMSGFNMVRYTRRTAPNTWSAGVNVDNGGSINWSNGVAFLGASDRVHVFLKDVTNSRLYQRTLTAANALQTFPGAGFDTTITTDITPYGPGATWSSAAQIGVPYVDAGPITSVARLTSADAPTPTVEASASGVAPFVVNGQGIHALVADGTTKHLLYADSATQDLWHDSTATSTWGTDVEEWDAATINRISANVYTRSGTKIGLVVDNAATITYAEISLGGAPPPTTSLPLPTETVQRMLMRR